MNEVIRALLFLAGAGAFFISLMVLENWVAKRRGQTDLYRMKETITNLSLGVSYKVVDGVAIALFIGVFYDWVYAHGFQWNPELSWWSVLAIIVFVDFWFYWAHFLMHKVRWFWNAHVTHHSSENMNLSTALRQNFTYAISGTWILWWIPAALVGFDKNWALIAIEGNLVYQFFLHTEQVKRLGWLESFMNTPSHHRVHHGSNPAQIDRNFGGILIIWDRIFGTFRDEREAGTLRYGVTRMPPKKYNVWSLQVFDWGHMIRDVWRYKDLRIPFKHPDWTAQKYGSASGES